MKCLVLFFGLVYSFCSFSQIELYVDSSIINSGDTIKNYYFGTEIPTALYASISVKNNSSNEQNVFVKFDKIAVAPGCDMNSCWGAHCNYASAVQSIDSVPIQNGETYTGLQINYHPYDIQNQESIYRFTFVDANNIFDTAFVYCVFGVNEQDNTGLDEISISNDIIYSNHRFILNSNDYNLLVYNHLGQKIQNDNLNAGIYFVELLPTSSLKKSIRSKYFIHE